MKRSDIRFIFIYMTPLLGLLPVLSDYAYPFSSRFSDVTISHVPNLIYLRSALSEWGGVPLWSNTILSGYPFAANPLSGLWYPPGWLGLVLPIPAGFNLLIGLHLFWGGTGMFAYLRAAQYDRWAALMGGLVFTLMPKLFAHYAAGHVTLVYAVCWTPWLLWAEQRRYESSATSRATSATLVGLGFGMIALADVRWLAYSALLWLAFSIHQTITQPGSSNPLNIIQACLNLRQAIRWVFRRVSPLGLGVWLGAPVLLPLVEYARLSTRSLLSASDNLIFSLQPIQLLGLVIPNLAGYAEWILYPGAGSFLLLVWVIFTPAAREKVWFWIGTILVALLFSLGSSTPLGQYLAQIPGFSLLRVPPRAIFIAGIGFSVMTACGVQELVRFSRQYSTHKRSVAALALTAVTGFCVMVAAGVSVLEAKLVPDFGWGAVAAVIFCLWILLRQFMVVPIKPWLVVLAILISVDLGGVNISQVRFKNAAEVLAEGREIASFLDDKVGLFRTYSPSYSLPQQTAALYRLELADGVDPMQLRSYAGFMSAATGVLPTGYSVTLPPFDRADPSVANRVAVPNPQRLGLLNVRYIVAEYDLAVDGLEFKMQLGSTRIYENQRFLPRAWVQPKAGGVGENTRTAHSLEWSPNRIEIKATGPGLLVLSEMAYPGWSVAVDRKQVSLVRVAGLLRGVELPDGEHTVVFYFRPFAVYAGVLLGILGWGWTFYTIYRARRVEP